MNCEQTRNQLSDYIDGELSAESMAGVAAHLESCPDCSRVYGDMTNLVSLMGDMDTIDEPADLAVNVRTRLAPGLEPAPTPWSRLRAFFAPPAVRIPAAAAVLAAVMLMVLYLPTDRESGSLIPDEIGRNRGLVQEKPARVEADADAEGEFARELDDEAAGEKMKRGKKGEEADKLAATDEVTADELRDQEITKQEPPAPASEVVESKQSLPASTPAETAPKKDSPASPQVAKKGNDYKESLEEESAAGRQEREQVAAPTVDDLEENLAVTESDQRAARFSTLKSINEPAPEPAFGGTIEISALQDSLVAAAVDSVGGGALRATREGEAPSDVILVAIPADRYEAFLILLDAIGVSRGRLPDQVPGGVQTVTVKIVVK